MTLAARRNRVFARRKADDSGISLIELLVSMLLLGVVSVMVMGMFVSTVRATTLNRVVSTDTRMAANGMNEMSRIFRAATENPVEVFVADAPTTEPALLAASANSITLYAYVNLGSAAQSPQKVRFSVNAQRQLVETTWQATTQSANGHWNFSATPLADRILAGPVTAGTSLFAYLGASGDPLPVPSAGITDSDSRRSIKAIAITVAIKSEGSNTESVTLKNTVGMPNLGLKTIPEDVE